MMDCHHSTSCIPKISLEGILDVNHLIEDDHQGLCPSIFFFFPPYGELIGDMIEIISQGFFCLVHFNLHCSFPEKQVLKFYAVNVIYSP